MATATHSICGRHEKLNRWLIAVVILVGTLPHYAIAQSSTGELRLKVADPQGLGLRSTIELVCDANQINRTYTTDASGWLEARMLPFGVYTIKVGHENFESYSGVVEIRSELPTDVEVRLSLEAVKTVVEVRDSDTLVDPHRVGTINRVGQEVIQNGTIAMPGRSIIDLVNSKPGWVLESNGTLHPRGSENQTQYVVDGVPLTDNRSATFAPQIEPDDVESMTILTASFPAEYGRKLGGVVEISTNQDIKPGFHGRLVASDGSFGTGNVHVELQEGWDRNSIEVSGGAASTNRYLDPPAPQNFNNHAAASDFSSHYEREFTPHDRLGLSIRHEQTSFQVPNDAQQQAAGQLQGRANFETMGILSYQHIFSTNLLADFRLMSRDVSARLTSNELSTPIVVNQERGFREEYVKGGIAAHHQIHDIKAGVEVDYGSVNEQFSDAIADSSQFDPGTPLTFNFFGKGIDREQAAYVQDLVRLGRWTLSAGVRWDHYQLLVNRRAMSPRLGAAWFWPRTGTVFHASYDRIFQTPAFENILLASSAEVTALNPQVLRVPVQPSSGNYYEAGFTQSVLGKLSLEGNYYRRFFTNYADDDVLLNTGVSIPISFRKANIYGAEAKLEVPHWGRISGFLSYSYLVGFGYTPVTGGVFLGNDATTALNSGRFPITQDQRNTVRTRAQFRISSRLWVALSGSYESGLPTEFDGTPEDALQQFGPQITSRVDFARGRVRPSFVLSPAAGADLIKHEHWTTSLQAQVQNVTNRFNLINFAGLFSGTGIAPPRSYAVRAVTTF
jgi:outer membrane cobalamin receptor